MLSTLSEELPLVVGRLLSLKEIHERGATALNTISTLKDDQNDLKELLDLNATSLEKLEENMRQNQKTILQNFQTIQERMTKLENQ